MSVCREQQVRTALLLLLIVRSWTEDVKLVQTFKYICFISSLEGQGISFQRYSALPPPPARLSISQVSNFKAYRTVK